MFGKSALCLMTFLSEIKASFYQCINVFMLFNTIRQKLRQNWIIGWWRGARDDVNWKKRRLMKA